MFGIGGFELFLILIFGFLVFGPDKLPAIAQTIGRAIAKFRNAQQDMADQLSHQGFIDKDATEPFKNPLEVIEQASEEAKQKIDTAQTKADAALDAANERAESFAERKARYDKERAEKKVREARLAKERAQEEQAAEEKRAQEKENPMVAVKEKAVTEAADDAASQPSTTPATTASDMQGADVSDEKTE